MQLASNNEIWKDVFGWESLYEVSSTGRVRSKSRRVKNRSGYYMTLAKNLNPNPTKRDDYFRVKLSHGNKAKSALIHLLVLEAFIGPKPKGFHGCHNNGNRKDNRLENLRWDTPYNNYLDSLKHKTLSCGDHHTNAKTTNEQALKCRELYANGYRIKQIATALNLPLGRVSSICHRRTWRYLEYFQNMEAIS